MNDSMYSPIAVPSSGNPVQVDVVSVAQQGPLGPVGPVGPEGPKGDPGNYPEAPNDAYVYGRGGNPVVNWMRALPLAGGSLTGTLAGTTAVFDTVNTGTLNATAPVTFSNGLSVTGGSLTAGTTTVGMLTASGGTMTGPLGVPNGTSAAPGLAIGALDGTGLMRSGTAMVFGIQNAANLAMFAGGTSQFYGPLAMLNNKITGLADATAAQDALNQRSGDARYLSNAGGTLSGPLTLSANAASALQPVTLQQMNAATGAYLPLAGGTVTGATTFGSTLGVTGAATLSGNLTLNAAGGTPALHVSGPTATFRTIRFETAGQARLSMALDNSAETGTTGSGVVSNFILSTFDNTGVALASPLLTINRATPFTLTYAGRIVQNVPTIAGAVTNQGYFSQAAITGSDNTAGINALNTWAINSDTQARTGNLGFSNAILYNFGGTGFSGGRGGLFVSMMQTGASTSTGFIEGIQSSVNLYYSLGGSNTAYNAQGSATCFNPYMFLGSGATNLQGWSGAEFDFNVNASATYQTGVGILIVHTPGHAGVGAFQSDAAIQLADGSAVTAGWDYGIMFGGTNGRYPIKSTGTMLYARPSRNVGVTLNAAAGIDFSACTFSGSALKLPNGFAVDGSGNAQIGTGYINQTAGGISVDVSGSVVTAAAIVSGGSGWPTDGNQYFATDANGGVYAIGNTGGVANSIVILQPSFAKGTPPANPVTLTPDGVAAGLGATSITVNLTWSARTALALNPSGGAVRLGSGCFTANGTTSVSLTALAPAAAHATVQEWLTITDAGGTVRYIPCF